jgi:hypothetical protein
MYTFLKKAIVFIMFFLSSFCNAQQKIQYSSITTIGGLYGSSDNAVSLQQICGVQIKKTAIGIGVGIDNYAYKSIPVFVDARYFLSNNKWKPFAYAQAGVNYVYCKNEVAEKYSGWTSSFPIISTNHVINNTFFGESGIGLETQLKKHLAFNISFAYSYKHLQYTAENVNVLSSFFAPPITRNEFNFYMRRWALKVGVRLVK